MNAVSSPSATSTWTRFGALVRLGRPRFLAGGVVLYGLGALLAARPGRWDWPSYALGQAAITATQLMTHYCNDYFDLDADRGNRTPTRWSGGSRVLPDGELSPRVALTTAASLGLLAVSLDLWVLLRGQTSPGTPLLLAMALVLSWQYSAPPLRLHGRGLGPLTSALVVGGLTPLVGFGMQAGAWSGPPLLAVLPLMLAQFAMILSLDIPDRDGDAAARKTTIAVLLGQRTTARLCACFVAATYAILPALTRGGLAPSLEKGLALTAPVGALFVLTLLFGTWRRGGGYRSLAWRSVLWFAALSLGELLGAIVLQ